MSVEEIIRNFSGKNILIVGDIILDRYIWGKVSRISPEAPVPVVEVTEENFLPGGSANVAANITSLGGKAYLVGVKGNDRAGEILVRLLDESGIITDGIFTDERPTTVKTRVIAHHQQVVRFDKESNLRLNSIIKKKIIDYIRKMVNNDALDAVIISDYKKGVIDMELVKEILKLTRKKDIFVSVDPKPEHFPYYRGVSLITPNFREASEGSGIKIKDEESLIKAGNKLLRSLKCDAVLITRGEEGMSLFLREDGRWKTKRNYFYIPARAKKVFDVTGAGDTVIATVTLAYVAGSDILEACEISNYAAGIVVGEVGTATVTQKELLETIKEAKKLNSLKKT